MRLLFSLLILLTLVGCTSVAQLLEEGRYAEAYARAAEPCTRARTQQRPLKPRQLLKLQATYSAVQEDDLERVTALEAANLPATWPGRYHLYTALYERSREYTDLVPPEKRQIRIKLRPSYLAKKREAARLAAGVYYLHQAAPHLPAARRGNKDAARDAFYDIEAALDYLPERAPTLAPLLDTLAENGTLRIWLYPVGDNRFTNTLQQTTGRMRTANRDWTEITRQPFTGQQVDLEAEVSCLSSSSSGLRVSTSTEIFSKEVLDWIEKKKKKVKVNDTTWVEKIVEIKHFKTIHAEVTTHTESLEVRVDGNLVVYLPEAETPLWEKRLWASEEWSDTYTTCSGDRRALPAFSCVGPSILHRPGEWELIDRAVAKLPYGARSALFQRYAPPPLRKQRAWWKGLSIR